EGEAQKQRQQAEQGGLQSADVGLGRFIGSLAVPAAQAEAELDDRQEDDDADEEDMGLVDFPQHVVFPESVGHQAYADSSGPGKGRLPAVRQAPERNLGVRCWLSCKRSRTEQNLKYRKLGRTDLDVSLIGLGTMTWGEQNTEAQAHQQLDYALERGVNLIDAAEMYPVPPKPETQGRTETYIGTWLARTGRRQDIV